MLGRHADSFFRKQMRERIIAGSPNGNAQSIAFPDRELAGTGRIRRVSGHYEMPGPQNQISANSMLPGMQGTEMLPGMGQMLPGMSGEMMPGMGQLDLAKYVPWALAAAAGVAGYMVLRRSSRKSANRRPRRRRGRPRDSFGRFVPV